jgi:membrane-associated phospholipid phosphatase
MDSIWQWGLGIIHWLQQFSSPPLDLFFVLITSLGEEEFFLVVLPVLVWTVDFQVGMRLVVAFLLATYANSGLKALFAHPRPFELEPGVQLREERGYGLPSGHAQLATVGWGYLAVAARRVWVWVMAVALILLIGLSRVYLGVHFPTDVLAGWTAGVLFLLAYLWLAPGVESWLRLAPPAVRLTVAIGVPLLLLLLLPTEGAIVAMGVLLGAGLGLTLHLQITGRPFDASGPLWKRLLRLPVGLAGLLALYMGLKILFPEEGDPFYLPLRTVRYSLVGLWATWAAPWLFQRLALARRSDTIGD